MTDPIKHVVLLMLENHSFDQMLGCFKAKYPGLEGVDPLHPGTNADAGGKIYAQTVTEEFQMSSDPMHEHPAVMEQLSGNNGGFIRNFVENYPGSSEEERWDIMGYYPRGFLPGLHGLAEDFLICDHWFSSLPGPTWPNRFFALSGTSSGHVEMPAGWKHPDFANWLAGQNQTTLFDRLSEAGKNWLIYYYDIPDSLLFVNQRKPENLSRYRLIDQFFKDALQESAFPDFAFIEPKYFGLDQNDDHPPHNVMKAEKLIADVYNALRSNDALWQSTLLVVLYDEHGGFYDHMTPPPTVAPDDKTSQYAFNQFGVRVPALLVSPWVKRGFTDVVFDHTSLLKYLTDKWGLGPLGNRTAQAKSFASFIESTPRDEQDTIPCLRVPYTDLIPPKPALQKEDQSAHHQALHDFADHLEESLDERTAKGIADLGLGASAGLRCKTAIGRFAGGLTQRISTAFEGWRMSRQNRSRMIVKRYMRSAQALGAMAKATPRLTRDQVAQRIIHLINAKTGAAGVTEGTLLGHGGLGYEGDAKHKFYRWITQEFSDENFSSFSAGSCGNCRTVEDLVDATWKALDAS